MSRGFTQRVMHRHIGAKLEDNKGVLALVLLCTVIAWAGKTCKRFWRTSTTLASVGYLYASSGTRPLVEAAAATLVALTVWWGFWRESYDATVTPFVKGWVRHWFAYAPRWRTLAYRHGLVVHEHVPSASAFGYIPPPVLEYARLVKVRCTPATDLLTVKIPAGLDPAAFERASVALGHATKSLGCQIRPVKPGRICIELLRRDLLAKTVPALPIREGVDLARVPVGRRVDGRLWEIAVNGGHTLVAGSTGAGKDSITHSTLRALAPAIAQGWVQPWGFDPKGGMELAFARELFPRLFTTDPEAMAAGLEEVAATVKARAERLAGHTREHTPTADEPFILVVICELAALTVLCERKTAARIERALGELLTMGRAPGCAVIASLQDPGKDVLRWRNLFTYRIALRLGEAIEVDMVLGDGARDRGALADQVDPKLPGVGYQCLDGRPDPIRVRAAYCTDTDIRAVAKAHAYASRPVTAPSRRGAIDLTKPAEGSI